MATVVTDGTRQYTYSFSGADAKAFVWYPGVEELITPLDSLHTVSVSVHESKGQARALGHRGIKGLARGVRTIAGSLILTVIKDNPLRPLMGDNLSKADYWPGWSVDWDQVGAGTALNTYGFDNYLAPLLPPFNMLIQYVSEGAIYSNWDAKSPFEIEGAAMLIKGIEFLDEGIVTSVNDIYSEVTLSFIATDLKPMSFQTFTDRSLATELDEASRALKAAQEEVYKKLFGG